MGLSRTKVVEIMDAGYYADEPDRVLGELIHDMIVEAPESFETPHKFLLVIKGHTVARISLEGDIKNLFGVEEATK